MSNVRLDPASIIGKIVTAIAPLTFGVYLIHDNPAIRTILWNWIGLETKQGIKYFELYVLMVVFAIFFVCIGIDAIRTIVFKHTVDKMKFF